VLYFIRPEAIFHFNSDKLPNNWLPMDTETPAWTDLVPVCPESGPFTRVSAKFYATLPQGDYKVCRIYRVQNLDLWHKYLRYVSSML